MPETAQPEAASDQQATGAPPISLSRGGGALRGIGERFAANPATGTASFSVPVVNPSGRSGFGPKLSLSYDSGSGNGPFGFGWQLAQSSISRRTDRGVPRYEDALGSDTFVLSEAGELVPAAAAPLERLGHRVERFRPRIERDFTRIERWTRLADGDVHWRAISRDNVLSVYGLDASSRVVDPDDPRRVFSWLICHSYDDKGNAIVYDYLAEDAAGVDLSAAGEQSRARGAVRYLKRIRYGNRVPLLIDSGAPSFRRPHAPAPDFATADWMFEVVLDYGEGYYAEQAPDADGRVIATATADAPPGSAWPARADAFSSYRPGFELRTYRLCRRALVFHHFPDELGTPDCLVRSTELEYAEKPIGSFVTRIVQSGYRRGQDGRYLKRSLPPLDLSYSQSPLEDPAYEGQDARELDSGSLENLSPFLDAHHQWVDLDGEGIAGMLSEEGGGWYYKPNLGEGRLGPAALLNTRPSLEDGGRQVPLDLAGDGTLDMVWLADPTPGFNSRTDDGSFAPFIPFESYPTLDWRDPSARLVDVVGDGLADMLVLDGECLYWHRSLGTSGFDEALRIELPQDEDQGPRVVFADRMQSIFVADMSGDGLADIVRIADGEVCYWPNLGYGRFGRKVTMDAAPSFEPPELFDPRRVRLADSDGSGTADIVYLGADAVRVYLNLCGNGWSDARLLREAPATNGAASVTVGDLLGHGTACLIWSSALPAEARERVRYLDLMGGVKPHLLVEVRNNVGGETRVEYSASTSFYLADKAAGTPWVTRLPFPVHVVERIDTLDRAGRNRYVTRYRYHHGYFDGAEREFRGFGRVEQLDTDELAALSGSDDFPGAENVDAASYVPPVMTRMWFHTGAPQPLDHEYFGGAKLAAPTLPAGLSSEDARQARRALTGSLLRFEVSALDGSEQPHVAREHGYSVAQLEPSSFHARACEAIELEFDRGAPTDPRVMHRVELAYDAFGNPTLSASVAYGRRPDAPADPLLTPADVDMQQATHATFTTTSFTGVVTLDDAYRAPLECDQEMFQLHGAAPAGHVFTAGELSAAIAVAGDGAHDLPHQDFEGTGALGGQPFRRCIEHVRTVYRANDLSGPLAPGTLEALALPHTTYRLGLTAALATDLYVTSGKLPGAALDAALSGPGGYVHSQGDADWWLPSSRVAYSPGQGDSPAQELAAALAHFFLPRRFSDPFGGSTRLDFDAHDLLPAESADALGNTVQATNDYRVLEPALVVDANGNRSAVAYDALGDQAGTALMGKEGEHAGDSLDGFDPDLIDAVVVAHLADPLADPGALLARATTRTITDRGAQPPVAYTMARETHVADLQQGESSAVQHRFSYSDGFGHEVQEKRFAGPGSWLTSGWTILNNKGKPVRSYEPFVDDTPAFKFASTVGVSAVRFYDPLGRIVAVAHPHKAWQKTLAGPWRTEGWDVNDTLLLDPKTDPDAGEYFSRLPDGDYLPTWYDARAGGGLGPDEQDAALKTAVHAGTPEVVFSDALGRGFLTIAHNRFKRSSDPPADPPTEEQQRSLVVFDVEDNERRLVDAPGRECARYAYDLAGNRVNAATMENGERWMLFDVLGKPIRAWDSRGHEFASTYDPLRRLLTRSVHGTDPARSDPRTLAGEVLFEKVEYGEGLAGDVVSNLRTRVVRQRDGAGVVTTDLFDFKGNCLSRKQELLDDFEALADWAGAPALDAEAFTNLTSYDALNRVATMTTPDSSVAHVGYDPVNRLATLDVNVRGAADATHFVQHVEYNARGDRTRIDYGNGTRTDYEHDAATFRLTRQHTTRPAGGNGFAARVFAGPTTLQDLHHTYDPYGNLLRIADAALRTVVSGGQPVQPEILSAYDAVYRLIESGGREQSDPADVEALRNYSERYEYDLAGNLVHLVHAAAGGNWQRDYEYSEPSRLEPAKRSNRLTRSTVGGAAAPALTYDEHGSTTQMSHLSLMRWDFKDQLSATSRQVAADPETVFYAYSAAGARVRKVVRRQNGTRRSERIYLLNAEVYREFAGDGTTVSLRRDSLHIMDDRQRVALVETVPGSDPVVRYQLANHLGSACVEVDGSGAVISYEEFSPFGQAAVVGGRSVAEVSLKRYRYTGKERDEENDFTYYGARYYAAWIGRWISCDPEGLSERRNRPARAGRGERPRRGWNLYVYAGDSPYVYNDPTGRQSARTIATLVALIPTGGLLVTAGLLAIYDATQTHGPEDKRWVSFEEGGLIDFWTIFHYLIPATIGLVVSLALDKIFPGLSPEAIYAISGMTAATIAWIYEVYERPLWSHIHKWTGDPSRLNNPVLGWAARFAHSASKDAALEWQTNTVGDIMIGTLGAFTFSYLYFLYNASRRPVDTGFAISFFVFGETLAFIASHALVYGGFIQTRDTHYYDPVNDQYHLLPRPQLNDRLDPRYTPFQQPVYA